MRAPGFAGNRLAPSAMLVLVVVAALLLPQHVMGQGSKALVQCEDSARLRPVEDLAVRDEDDDDKKTRPLSAPQKKVLIVGHEGLGLGNYLISFPSAYNFAVSTGRDIVIADGTLLSEFCNIIMCGFHSYSYWIIKSELMIHTANDLKAKRVIAKSQTASASASASTSAALPKPSGGGGGGAAGGGGGGTKSSKAAPVTMRRRLAEGGGGGGGASKEGEESSSSVKPKPRPKGKPGAGDASPKVLEEKSEDKKQGVPSLRAFEFLKFFKGDYPLETFQAIHVYGYLHKTGWLWEVDDEEKKLGDKVKAKDRVADKLYDCLEELSQCKNTHAELHCLDRHALQQLVVGPFVSDRLVKKDGLGSSDRSMSKEYLLKTTRNLPVNISKALLHNKFLESPRMDVAVHLRNMFHFFEESEDEARHQAEVAAWLSSKAPNEGIAVFRALEEMILNVTRPAHPSKQCRSVTVFVSADNSLIKEAFVDYLEARESCGAPVPVTVSSSSSSSAAASALRSNSSASASASRGAGASSSSSDAAGRDVHRQLRGSGWRWRDKLREEIQNVKNYFIPAEKSYQKPKVKTAEELERAARRKNKPSPPPSARSSTAAAAGGESSSSSNSSASGSGGGVKTVEEALRTAEHPKFMRTSVGAPTASPVAKVVRYQKRLNRESVDFTVVCTTPTVHHSRQIKSLNSHGGSSLDMVLDWYLLALANNILSYRKDGTVSTFAWSAQMINGPKVKGLNVRFEKPDLKPVWHPYTDPDGQIWTNGGTHASL